MPVSVGSWNERYKASPGGSAIGDVDGVAPTPTNIQNGSFVYSRFLYNVYCAGDPTKSNKCGTAAKAATATVRYIGFNGWICKASNSHKAVDPITGPTTAPRSPTRSPSSGSCHSPSGATGGGTTITNYCRLFQAADRR